ncbi:UbiA prenyltransferase family domain-containing protein [Trichoderma ceciliae]
MSPKYLGASKYLWLSFFSILQHELDVTVRLLQSNFVGFLFIFLGGLLSRAIRSPMPIAETAMSMINAMIVGLLCNYIFDIANQASSPQEDYLNKPNRPIPAGLITIDQANTRWVMAWTLGPIITYFFFGVWATLHLFHFMITIIVCYVWPRWFSWFMRNYFAASSYIILARLLNQVLARNMPNWKIGFLIDFIIFGWIMGTIHIQEFYDLEGDRKSDRKTLPMLLSDEGLKILRASVLIVGYKEMARDNLVVPICIVQQILSCILAYRIWASKSIDTDKATYQVYYYPSILTILLSLVKILG